MRRCSRMRAASWFTPEQLRMLAAQRSDNRRRELVPDGAVAKIDELLIKRLAGPLGVGDRVAAFIDLLNRRCRDPEGAIFGPHHPAIADDQTGARLDIEKSEQRLGFVDRPEPQDSKIRGGWPL